MSKAKLPNQEDITLLSELRDKYNCFNNKEQPYYHALSNAIQVLRREGDWINRESVKEKMQEAVNFKLKWTRRKAVLFSYAELESIINSVPTSDYDERPAGTWGLSVGNQGEIYQITCSECGYTKGRQGLVIFNDLPRFCEKCGAAMRGNG